MYSNHSYSNTHSRPKSSSNFTRMQTNLTPSIYNPSNKLFNKTTGPKEVKTPKDLIEDTIQKLFNHYSGLSNLLSNEQYKIFLSESGLFSDTLSEDYSDVLFYTLSKTKDSINIDEFKSLIIKISEIKFPDEFHIEPTNAVLTMLETYALPLLNMLSEPREFIKTMSGQRLANLSSNFITSYSNVDSNFSFNDVNHKLIISKLNAVLNKEIIESNYLLFLKIYQKYFCFENLKIAKEQKNKLSQKAFVKIFQDFNISPQLLSDTQLVEIYYRLLDNKDYALNVIASLINVTACNNDGMWFTLYHFMVGVYLVAVSNLMVRNFDPQDPNKNTWQVFVSNNDSEAFESLVNCFYKNDRINDIMPEDMRKLQFNILKASQSKRLSNDENDLFSDDISDINFVDSGNVNNLNSNLLNSSNLHSNNLNNKNKSPSHFNFTKSKNDRSDMKKRSLSRDKKTLRDFSDLNKPFCFKEIAPLILEKYNKQLVTIYKYYCELYFETIFSVYMTHNGFSKFVRDIGLLEMTKAADSAVNKMTATQRYVYIQQRANKLNFSNISFIFSKFSSVTVDLNNPSKNTNSNKRINFINFLYILLCFSNKIYNPAFNSLSYSDKVFCFDDLTSTSMPLKFVYCFMENYINPLYLRVKSTVEEETFNISKLSFLFDTENVKFIVEKITPILESIIKVYTDGKDAVNYNTYLKILSDFDIFPALIQRNKMNKIFISFVDNFDETFLMQGNSKVEMSVINCSHALLFIGIIGNESLKNGNLEVDIKLMNFIHRMGQSDKLGKLSIESGKTKIQRDFINCYFVLRNAILDNYKQDANNDYLL